MTMTNYLVPKDEWRAFCITSYSFLNSIHEDFSYKINKSANPNEDDPLEYRKIATPTIAMFLAFGVSEREILEEEVKMAMKPITRQTSLNYLKSKGYTQLKILKLIIDNWDTCPDMLKLLLRKYNSNFVFPQDKQPVQVLSPKPVAHQPTNPFLPNNNTNNQQSVPANVEANNPPPLILPRFIPPVDSGVRPVKPYAISFTNRDRAIAKYINSYLVDVMGYNTFDAIHTLFKERGATDFVFNNGYEVISGEDFRRLRNNIQEYAKSNFTDVVSLTANERINFYKFKLILVRFVEVFQYAPDVVHNPISQHATEVVPTPQIPITANTQPLSISVGINQQPTPQAISVQQRVQPVPEPQVQVPIPVQQEPVKQVPVQQNNSQVSKRTAQMIEIFVQGLDADQTKLAFVLLQDASSLNEFSEAVARRFALLNG